MNLNLILKDYKDKFSNKQSIVHLNYVKIPTIRVSFELNNLSHILGLHKVSKKKSQVLVQEIDSGKFTKDNFKRHEKYKEVSNRIENYQFLKDVFYNNVVDVCIVRKDLKKNNMNLDIVFFTEKESEVIVLGLRKDSKTEFHYPTTLHTDYSRKYKSYRKTKIIKIEWL